MVAPETEEVGFKHTVMSASDYNVIVPIKKRRFTIVQSSPSSPHKELSSLSLDDNLVKVAEPGISDGITVSSSVTITTSELSEKKEISFSEESERKVDLCNSNRVQSNIEPSGVRFQEDDACFNHQVENKAMNVENEKHALHLLEKPELKLPTSDPNSKLGLCANKKRVGIDRKELEKCKSLTSLVKTEAELSVGLNERLVPDLVVKGSDRKWQKQNNLEPVSLNLSLSKQGSYTQCLTSNVGSDYDGSLQQSNRGNWDLNTSMESWEGCASDDPSVQVPVVQTNTIVTTHRCSTEMVRADISSGKPTPLDQSDYLHLSLNSSDLRPVTKQEQISSVKLDFRSTDSSLSSPGNMQFDDLNVALKVVKAEPFVKGSELESKSNEVKGLGLSGDALMNGELDDQCNLELPKASNICSPMNIVKAKSFKSEPVYESKKEALEMLGGRLNLISKQVLPDVDNSCPIAVPVVAEMSEAARNPSCSTYLATDGDMLNHSELPTPTKGNLNECGGGLVNSEKTDITKDPGLGDSSISIAKPFNAEDENQNNPKWCLLKLSNEQCSGLQGGEESSVSDEEKISLSADILEEYPYSSEYESDGKQDVDGAMAEVHNDIEEDYEDGEVREPLLKTQVESSVCVKREVENFDHGDFSKDKKINSVGLPGTDFSTLISVKQENKLESHDVRQEDKFHSVTTNQSSEQEKDEASYLKEILVEENASNKVIKATGRRQLFHCEERDALEDQNSSDKATDGIEEPIVTVSQGDAENVKTVDFVRNNDPVLPNVKEPVNNDDATDDFIHGSRHINPCHGSTSSSPSKTRSNSLRSVLTRTDREQILDVALEGGKLQPQGRYSGVSQKIYVNRHQNLSPQTNFHRRERFTIRTDSLQGEWDFNPTVSPGIYSDQIPYDAPRRKYLSAVSDDDIDQNHYKIKPNGPFRSAGRQGRQILDDEGPPYCHIPSRRKSPGIRDGPPVRGVKMVHRMPRNISPSGCIREAGSELVGPRHGEKFMRTFEDETMDPIYAHPQPPYEVDRPPFIRERRNFTIQRKTFPRIDSKSPGRSRGRSPGQWVPGKRKSYRFCGHLGMTRRSSPGYRGDRMRSPDQPPPIHGDMPVRRHGFPFSPLPSSDLRDMRSAPDQGHMRSDIRCRNRSDRLSFRNRRFEIMDPRDRIESSEYFDGPSQLNELSGDGNDDDRRRFSDRHEHLHSFRPQYNDSDGENYHNNAEDSRRPFRFCAEDGPPEFHERGNMREREFNRRVKNQPGNLTRRTGVVIEEHEVEDYRHGRQMWNDHGFEDISRMKRKRF
ncbi:uncharacterized protein LOC111006113 isoform X2 [Momordica charantia]|uniref:Uncharacterized protein LOC111006113 isoform X2 n=1 Tax=Momordica charantia TaxID=3673 RepID=A0A6J1BVK8_MOMCH|nr:uncharacterized protein LOC111006113 isoform X2 [Momordica charantia]